jgi:hypothetical protein
MRNGLKVCLLTLIAIVAASSAEAEWERAISLEQALKASDTAIGFPKGRPDDYDVTTAKLLLSNHFSVNDEGLSQVLEDMASLSPPKKFWLIVYRRWPPRLDDDLVVFIDAKTGGTIRVYRYGRK